MYYKEIPYKLACVGGKGTIDLYFKVKGAYRLFAAEGASFSEEHHRFCNKVTLFIQSEDLAAAQKDLDSHILSVLKDSTIGPKDKAELVYSFSMKSLRKAFGGTNTKTVEDLKRFSGIMVESILKERDIVSHVMEMTSIDHFVLQHSVKTAIFAVALAGSMFEDTLNEHDLPDLCTGFFLHDIGMTKVPRHIVDKEDDLTPNEWEVIRKHPLWGHDKLNKTGTLSKGAASIVLYHHERCQGRGYPYGLSGNDIPLYAKICAIADTFESLTALRPFRPPKTPFEALTIMQKEMAAEFDPALFKAFIMLLGPGM